VTEQGALGIEAVAMTKRFGDFTALDDVTLRVRPGSFHALLGENGAGKSTLVKCIMGYYRPEEGEVIVGEREREIANPRQAHTLGIGMVYQHFTLVPNMTVAENLVLAQPDLPTVINWRYERPRLEEFLEHMPFKVPLDRMASGLAAGEKQKVEILKQLYLDRRFLILDEPTSVLTPAEADEVLGLLQRMTRDGRLTILMITHKFREVMAFADEVSVLRRGRLVGGGMVADLDPDRMAAMMVGEAALPQPKSRNAHLPGAVRLQIDTVSALDDGGQPAVRGLSLEVRAGEILGIAGVSGNGQRELVEVLAGQRQATGGKVLVDGQTFHARRNQIRSHRVALLPEEPLRNACAPNLTVAENMGLRRFDVAPYARGPWLNPRAFREAATGLIARYRVKTPSPQAPIKALSGGNIQRAVLARELGEPPSLLIVANPVFGLDFHAVAEIHNQIIEARNQGAAVLLISEDLDELFELADRIAVMFAGRIVHETAVAVTRPTEIGRHMAGHGEDAHEAA